MPKASGAPDVSLSYRPLPLKLAHTWTIARGSSDEKKNGLLTLTAEGVTGYGEAAANKRWNQSYETSEAAFARVKGAVAGLSPWEHLTWLERAEKEAGPDTEVVAALDLALWDWKGKRLNRPVHELLGVPRGRMPVTTFSIGIDTAEVMKQKVREAAAFPRLKIKIGLRERRGEHRGDPLGHRQAHHRGRERRLDERGRDEKEARLAEHGQAALPRAAHAGGDGRRDGEAQGPRDVSDPGRRGRPPRLGRARRRRASSTASS